MPPTATTGAPGPAVHKPRRVYSVVTFNEKDEPLLEIEIPCGSLLGVMILMCRERPEDLEIANQIQIFEQE